MKKSELWVNICPRKLYYELHEIDPSLPNQDQWWDHPQLLKKQMKLLKQSGIIGIKLNIFNFELTSTGKHIDFSAIAVALAICEELNMRVHICLGPYQYPLWPGIRLPQQFLDLQLKKNLEQNKNIRNFGTYFIGQLLKKYGRNKLVSGFYLGNEWHTQQEIENYHPQRNQKKSSPDTSTFSVSQKHMSSLVRECKKNTRKPIFFNTNIDPYRVKLIEHTFIPFMNILKEQFYLGFDLYPSQETLLKSPRLFFHRKLHAYRHDFSLVKKNCTTNLVLSELEAQPWGTGASWKSQIESNPQLVSQTLTDLKKTTEKIVVPCDMDIVTFWGAEFWLAAYQMGRSEILDYIQKLTS